MLIDLARQLSFLIFSFGCFGVSYFFAHLFYLRKTYSSFFDSLGFLLLAISSAVNLYNHGYSTPSYWFAAIGYSSLILGIIIDKHSIFRLLFPIPLIALYFLRNHQLMYTMAFLVLIAHVYLSYKIGHKRLIPMVAVFALVVAGEYIYSLNTLISFPGNAEAGTFVYLFAALILVGWILFYLIRAIVDLLRNTESIEPLD